MTDRTLRLWWASLPDYCGLYDALIADLPTEERERANRYQVDIARQRFIVARTVLRRQLGTSIGVHPEALVFASGSRGKPRLALPETDASPQFNLSHSGNVVVLAIASVDVGVDVESLREVSNAERMARRFFSPNEQLKINTLGGAPRNRAFLRIWTQKEAYLKATGLGVGMALREVETEPDPMSPPRLISVAGDRAEAARWTLIEGGVPGAVCTVAIRGPAPTLRVTRFTPADLGVR